MTAPASPSIPVYLELGPKRVFAGAADWPGWCRSGRDEGQALEALVAAAPRYLPVAVEAGLAFPIPAAVDALTVVERLPGSATTDFGAPAAIAAGDARPLVPGEGARLAALLLASWSTFDRVVAGAPAQLRKGPRGGGRDRDAIVRHVLAAEAQYVRKLGLRSPSPEPGDEAAIHRLRTAVVEAIRSAEAAAGSISAGWPVRYAARRIAWHVLDHAWEIEDRAAAVEPRHPG
ncbi:MAG TPA: hypothetical protein VFD49_12105 [Candidatus Dormibacteraeota bacterium]|nr:hypothetical protein [Candidatus Dormibacteraeota bacterium]